MRTREFMERLHHDRIVQAIAAAEAKTSGEIRVYIQRGEADGDPVDLARKQFDRLGMHRTSQRNAVLIFVMPRARKFAVIGDEGIHQKCGKEFWDALVSGMREQFKQEHFQAALVEAIESTGLLLAEHFPRRPDDVDELPNEALES